MRHEVQSSMSLLFYLITQDVAQGDHWHYTLVVAERESQVSLIDGGDADDRRAELDESPLIHASVELIAEQGELCSCLRTALAPADAAISTTRGRVGPRRFDSCDHRSLRRGPGQATHRSGTCLRTAASPKFAACSSATASSTSSTSLDNITGASARPATC